MRLKNSLLKTEGETPKTLVKPKVRKNGGAYRILSAGSCAKGSKQNFCWLHLDNLTNKWVAVGWSAYFYETPTPTWSSNLLRNKEIKEKPRPSKVRQKPLHAIQGVSEALLRVAPTFPGLLLLSTGYP